MAMPPPSLRPGILGAPALLPAVLCCAPLPPGRKPSALASYTPRIRPMNSLMMFLHQRRGRDDVPEPKSSRGWSSTAQLGMPQHNSALPQHSADAAQAKHSVQQQGHWWAATAAAAAAAAAEAAAAYASTQSWAAARALVGIPGLAQWSTPHQPSSLPVVVGWAEGVLRHGPSRREDHKVGHRCACIQRRVPGGQGELKPGGAETSQSLLWPCLHFPPQGGRSMAERDGVLAQIVLFCEITAGPTWTLCRVRCWQRRPGKAASWGKPGSGSQPGMEVSSTPQNYYWIVPNVLVPCYAAALPSTAQPAA